MSAPRKPEWMKRPLPPGGEAAKLDALLKSHGAYTVCQEAVCPNRSRCFHDGTATVLLLGPVCTRSCRFCAVAKGAPAPPAEDEAQRLADAAAAMGLSFVVLTMVSRDDLPGGGAPQVARTIEKMRALPKPPLVEVLISDLGGDEKALGRVLAAGPVVLNHNVETVPRLYPQVRPQADYGRSLEVLARSAASPWRPFVKSGMMLGLGEEEEEVIAVFKDLAKAGCRGLTLGQYLAPSENHHPVARFLAPEEFGRLAGQARQCGIDAVVAGPLVRSSYKAREMYQSAVPG